MKSPRHILLKQVKIIDPGSPHHRQQMDVLISNEIIREIAPEITGSYDEEISRDNMHLSPGWFDLRANFREPGSGDQEDLMSGAAAAMAAGFTSVALMPDTEPPLDRKSDMESIYAQAESSPLHIFPYAAITQEMKGGELTEMYDLYQAGALAFNSGAAGLQNPTLLLLAMQYVREFAPALHLLPSEDHFRRKGLMHEGPASTRLGLPGIPALAEELDISRHLQLAHYAETGVHFMGISSSESLRLLRQARSDKQAFTADVNMANLIFSDEDLHNYDSNLKVYPPLRSSDDRQALYEALEDGLLTAIVSQHEPHRIEDKRCEFENAAWGMAGLECFFGALWPALQGKVSLDRFIACITQGPRAIVGLTNRGIEEGAYAELTLFDPDARWQMSAQQQQSRAANNPFIGQELQGRPLGIINKGVLVLLDS